MSVTTMSVNYQDPRQVFEKYLQAVTAGMFNHASEVVQEALQAGIAVEAIYDQIFAPCLREVGQRWETGQMTVAQEHLATAITEYCRNLVVGSQRLNLAVPLGKVLLASVSGNQHTLGLNLLSDIFRWHGWEVYPVPGSLPEEEIANAALLYKVDLVCLSVALPGQIMRTIKAVQALRASKWQGLIEVGGAAFWGANHLAQQTGADFFGGDAAATVDKATQLLKARQVSVKRN